MKKCRSINRALKRGHLVHLNPYSSLFGYYRPKSEVTIAKARMKALALKEGKEDGGTD